MFIVAAFSEEYDLKSLRSFSYLHVFNTSDGRRWQEKLNDHTYALMSGRFWLWLPVTDRLHREPIYVSNITRLFLEMTGWIREVRFRTRVTLTGRKKPTADGGAATLEAGAAGSIVPSALGWQGAAGRGATWQGQLLAELDGLGW